MAFGPKCSVEGHDVTMICSVETAGYPVELLDVKWMKDGSSLDSKFCNEVKSSMLTSLGFQHNCLIIEILHIYSHLELYNNGMIICDP